ncbi:MAG: BrnT family toxin [Alphaproteobacteria bacterium]|nr:BrnT family toxin [Alphaproteobacteria bacterium]
MHRYEWDENKRNSTLEKHNIDFIDAIEVFASEHIKLVSRFEAELRFIAIGELDGIHIAVVFTVREDVIRIITARRARSNEREAYIEHVSGRSQGTS